MRFGILAIWILLFGSVQTRAEIVRARFAGTITQPASNIPHSFSPGEAIWGSYAFDSLSTAVENSYLYEQYPALRYLTIESTTGFYAQINWGTIIIEDQPNSASSAGVDQFQVVTLPPLVIVQSPFVNGPNAIPPVEEISTIAYDLDSIEEMVAQSQSLGLPGAAGAFLGDHPFWIQLSLSSADWLPSKALPGDFPSSVVSDQSFGELHFGPAFSSHPAVRFTISELSIIPEPSVMVVFAFAAGCLLQVGRQRFSLLRNSKISRGRKMAQSGLKA